MTGIAGALIDTAMGGADIFDPLCVIRSAARRTVLRRTSIGGVSYKIANCRDDWQAAFRLVHDAYVERGLFDPSDSAMRLTPFHLLPCTNVLVAERGGEAISTTSLVVDDVKGLPMDSVFSAEVDLLRAEGLQLAEVMWHASSCSCSTKVRRFEVFLNLMSMMAQSARDNGVDRLVIVVHPRHVRFYRRLLGFELLGGERPNVAWRNRPAVALQHDFAQLDQIRYPLYDRIYGNQFQNWELLWQPMRSEEVAYFTPLVDRSGSYPPSLAGAY